MAEQLKNTLQFVNLAPGASVVLPHGLQNLARPLAPDVIFVPNQALTVTASDETEITILNSGPGPLSGSILVESWHTIERSFGDDANQDLPIKPYVVVGTARVGGPVAAFVYRPGAVGADAPGGNVYTDWTALMAALDATKHLGLRLLDFDSAFQAPAPIPAGVWDMTNVKWIGSRGPTSVELMDGASIVLDPPNLTGPNELQIEGFRFVVYFNGVGPVTPFDGINVLCGGNNVRFANTNPAAKPMFKAQGFLLLLFSGECVNGGLLDYPSDLLAAPLLDTNGGEIFVFGGGGYVANNFATDLSGGPGGIVFIRMFQFTGDRQVGIYNQWYAPDLLAAGGLVLADDVGSPGRDRTDPQFAGLPVVPAASPYAVSYGEFVPVDTTLGAVVVNLPSAQRSFGERVTIKDVGGNALAANITIASTYGDTIEGTGLIATDGGSMTFVCWGSGIWSLVAQI